MTPFQNDLGKDRGLMTPTMKNQSLRDSLILARKSNPINGIETIKRRFSPLAPSECTTALGHNNPIDTESLDNIV